MAISEKELHHHLEAFISSFVRPEFHHRWRHFLFEKPDKARDELVKFYEHHNESRCEIVKSVVFLDDFIKQFGNVDGVFFDGDEPPRRMSATEFAEQNNFECIFSIDAGKRAFFLTHENDLFYCERAEIPTL